MELSALRLGDIVGGAVTTGSSNVFINGQPVVRVTDLIASHGSGAHSHASMSTGSSTVFCNGEPVCRVSDLATCGHSASAGSPNVLVG